LKQTARPAVIAMRQSAAAPLLLKPGTLDRLVIFAIRLEQGCDVDMFTM
jgi:hypothetical protein